MPKLRTEPRIDLKDEEIKMWAQGRKLTWLEKTLKSAQLRQAEQPWIFTLRYGGTGSRKVRGLPKAR